MFVYVFVHKRAICIFGCFCLLRYCGASSANVLSYTKQAPKEMNATSEIPLLTKFTTRISLSSFKKRKFGLFQWNFSIVQCVIFKINKIQTFLMERFGLNDIRQQILFCVSHLLIARRFSFHIPSNCLSM